MQNFRAITYLVVVLAVLCVIPVAYAFVVFFDNYTVSSDINIESSKVHCVSGYSSEKGA